MLTCVLCYIYLLLCVNPSNCAGQNKTIHISLSRPNIERSLELELAIRTVQLIECRTVNIVSPLFAKSVRLAALPHPSSLWGQTDR